MFTRRELERAIKECEDAQSSYQNCEKLATLYIIYDHLYTERGPTTEVTYELLVDDYGSSEFLQAVADKSSEKMWAVMDELMTALQVTNPRLYQGVIRKIAE